MAETSYRKGDVFQINEHHERLGWVGAFVMATEIKNWGIVGFVAWPREHDKQAQAYIRLEWSDVDHVGTAPLVPEDA